MPIVKFSCEITDSGSAFDAPAAELARIIRQLAVNIEHGQEGPFKLYDLNGNACGKAFLEIAADDEDDDSSDEDEGDENDPEDVQEITALYGSRHTPAPCYVLPDGRGGAWYALQGSVNLNHYHDADTLADGVNVERLEDDDTATAAAPINSAEDMARECRGMI